MSRDDHLSYAELAAKSRRRAAIYRVMAWLFVVIGVVYVTAFFVMGLSLGEWRSLFVLAGLMLCTSAFSIFSSARMASQTANRWERIDRGVSW